MKTAKFVFIVLIIAVFLAACSPAGQTVKYSMGPTEAATGCASPEPGKIGACKVPGSTEATVSPTETQPAVTRTLLASTAVPTRTSTMTRTPTPAATSAKSASQPDLVKTDGQGAVTVEIQPVNLTSPGDALVFDISMNTHSVDLSMDLAKLAVLSTDTGKTIQAIKWDAPRGGHHVSGKLSFPTTVNGKNIFDGAKVVTVVIKNVDAPSRTFSWRLNG